MKVVLNALRSQVRFLLSRCPLPANSRLAAVSGTTCSGKSSVIEYTETQMWFETQSEIYSALVAGGMAHPDNTSTDDIRRVQYTVLATQIATESALVARALLLSSRHGGIVLPVIERSVFDAAAYLPGGLDELLEVTDQSYDQLLARYGIVLHMGAPSEDVYEANFESNPHRRTRNYPAIFRRSHAIGELIKKHPRYGYVQSKPRFVDKLGLAYGALENHRRTLSS